ncbi:hypothetical protein BDN67DRAFT_1018130 [Paxillus ammoniavirescens]|nr:hypothetical protein BDN67DRAFT_1018130 [Paxillus ammoniavirescens]
MKQECDGVRLKLKARQVECSEADSDVEIIETPPLCKGKRQHTENIPDDIDIAGPIASTRLSATSLSPTSSSSSLPTLPSSGTSLATPPPTQSLPLPDFVIQPPSVLTEVIAVTVPSYDPMGGRVWPYGMYTTNMTAGFRQMDDKQLRSDHSQQELFELIFGVPWVKGTYHDNHRAWVNTNHTVLTQFEQAGHDIMLHGGRLLVKRAKSL